eukprot:13621404-Ditylum_brightwellii.AAC.1
MERSKQIKCVNGDKDNGVGNSDDDSDDNRYDNNDDHSDDDNDESGDRHLTHLMQIENNVNPGVCDRHLTH